MNLLYNVYYFELSLSRNTVTHTFSAVQQMNSTLTNTQTAVYYYTENKNKNPKSVVFEKLYLHIYHGQVYKLQSG